MGIGDVCTYQVICTKRDATVTEAAELMREFHVGTLVVVDASNGVAEPVGLITDRDIVVYVTAQKLDADSIPVDDIMSEEIITARVDDDVYETIRLMSAKGVRRLPVVDDTGNLVGIVSQDDLYGRLSQEFISLATITERQRRKEASSQAAL
jgi:CBS domain-containing protein